MNVFQGSCMATAGKQNAMYVAVAALLVLAASPGVLVRQASAQPVFPSPAQAIPQGSPIPRILPTEPPATLPGLPVAPPAATPSAVPDANVAIRSAAVEGVTAYPQGRVAGLVQGLVGPAISLARIEAARVALLGLYRNDGYALTTVGARVDGSGGLRFTVIEGHIADVKLEGDIGPAGVQVLRFLRRLTEKRPIDTATLERWLLLAQDVPGVHLRAVLRPSTEDPGALTLIAQVDRQAVSGLLTADNRAFDLTGPEQALAVLELNSVTQLGERTQVSLYHTSGDTQNFGQVATELFAGDSGLRVRLYAGTGKAAPSDFLRSIGYRGYTSTFGAAAIYPLIRQRQQTLNLSAALDAIQSETKSDTGANGATQITSRDALRVARFGVDYVIEDLLLGGNRSAINVLTARVSKGIGGLGSSTNRNTIPGRVNERVDFTKAAFEASRTQTLFVPWDGATVALRGRVLGQVSGDVLPPSEKFFLGGSDITRGFYSGQVTGDNAIAVSAELQLNTTFATTLFERAWEVGAQFYVFYDQGKTWENQRIDPNLRLSSEGIGARFNFTKFLEFDVEGVIRNTRVPQGTQGIVRPLDANAVFWRVVARF
jgi:hemolysin activation/secretion protein